MVGEPHSSTKAGAAELAHRAVTLDEEEAWQPFWSREAEGATGIGEMVQGRSGRRRGCHGRRRRGSGGTVSGRALSAASGKGAEWWWGDGGTGGTGEGSEAAEWGCWLRSSSPCAKHVAALGEREGEGRGNRAGETRDTGIGLCALRSPGG